ncbi:MAG: 4'-phosphopantetheinyl transferase superfamily protein [Draconibacterium sp.]
MPFVTEIQIAFGRAGIWELTESPKELSENFLFTPLEKTEFEKINAPKRQTEYLATRLLLQKLSGKKTRISYQPDGRPVLKESKLNISISHSANLVVVLLAETACGVDAELKTRNIENVAKRFLHPDEISHIDSSGNGRFLQMLHWCAKEAIFKCSRQHGIQFDQQIRIEPFDFETETFFSGTLLSENTTEHFSLQWMEFKNNIIVFCVEIENIEK